MRVGNNIRQRKDGRFEARYEKGRDENGHIIYGYCYGTTYEEAELKRSRVCVKHESNNRMNLLILGCGDLGLVVRDLVQDFRVFNKIAFLDDFKVGQESVLGPCRDFALYRDEYPIAIAAVGEPSLRCRWINDLERAGFIVPTLIHPSANVASNVQLGAGSVVCSGATVGIGATIGKGCIIDDGAIVERHATVPDWTLVESGDVFKKE